MTRKEELFERLRKAPTDTEALENAVAYFAHRGEFVELYQGLEPVTAALEDRDQLVEFRARVLDVVRKHLDSAADAATAAVLKLRLASMLVERTSEPKDGLILMLEAFEQIRTEDVGHRVLDMLHQMKLPVIVLHMLRTRAQAEKDTEKRADTLLQLGHAALAAGRVFEARRVFTELATLAEPWSTKGKDGLSVIAAAEEDLEKSIAQAQGSLSGANDVEKPVLKLKLARLYVSAGRFDDGTRLLEDLVSRGGDEEPLMELISVYRETESHERLLALVEDRADKDLREEVRKELLKERVHLYLTALHDQIRAKVALEEVYDRFPGVPDVVEFCAQTLTRQGDTRGLADLLAKARTDTKNRDQERRYLEWEAGLRWKVLGELEEAEKLYRRIKSIDPRNEASLVFYEEYCVQTADYRKLYTVLSTRASLVPDAQKVDILKRMARLSVEQLDSPDRAVESLKKVLVLAPDDKEGFTDLARLLEDTRRWHAAVDLYSARVDRLGEDAREEKLDLLNRMLDICSSKDKLPVPEMVVTIYRRMLQAAPDNVGAMDALADYYRNGRRYAELVDILSRKAQVEQNAEVRLSLHREVAELLIENMRQEAAAIPHLESVIALVPKDTQALSLLARAYKGIGDHEKFFDVGRKQLDVVGGAERAALLEELATAAGERLGREEDAVWMLESLLEMDPRHPWAMRRLRQSYTALERFEDLANLLRRGVEFATTEGQRQELKEKLAQVLSEKLGRHGEARDLLREVVVLSPGNRAARQTLQKMLLQAGDFGELEAMHHREGNLAGLLRFLEESRAREEDVDRALAMGMEMVRLADERMADRPRAIGILESLLATYPVPDVATRLLAMYPEGRSDAAVARALAVVADSTEGQEGRDIAVRLAEMLDTIGEHDASYTRTLGLFLTSARDGDTALFDVLVDRAEKAGALDALAGVVEELLAEDLPGDARRDLAVLAAGVYKNRLKDAGRAVGVLRAQLEHAPGDPAVLRELERVYTATSAWEDLEKVLRSLADQMPDDASRSQELHKLARLYEEILLDSQRAADVYRKLHAMVPDDDEALAGLERMLEELGLWKELASLVEEQLAGADDARRRELLLRLAGIADEKLNDADRAAGRWSEVLATWTEDTEAWDGVERLFAAGRALSSVIPLLLVRYEEKQDWERLVSVHEKHAEVESDDGERYAILERAAAVYRDRMKQPAKAFGVLKSMALINPMGSGFLKRLSDVGKEAKLPRELASVLKGLLNIGKSDFQATRRVEGSVEYDAALILADVARTIKDLPTAIDALKRARESAAVDLSLIEQLELLLDKEGRYEELLALLVEKKELVWEAPERRSLQVRIADLLTGRLQREEESIPWVEAVHAMDGAGQAAGGEPVTDRLEALYIKFGRWPELGSLLRGKLAGLQGERRRKVAHQLALVCRDHLDDLAGAFELLSDIVVQEPDNRTYLDALLQIVKMDSVAGWAEVAAKAVGVLEPIVTERRDWERLSVVLEAKATLATDRRQAARAWHGLGVVLRDKLNKQEKAFQALCSGVEAHAGNEELLSDMMAFATKGARLARALEALAAGLGGVDNASDAAPLKVLATATRDRAGDLEGAAKAYARLIHLQPEELEHYWALDEIYRKLDRVPGRIDVLAQVVDRLTGARRADVLVTLAELQWKEERKRDTVDSLNRAIADPELLEEPRRQLAFGRLTEALEEAQEWFELSQVLGTRIRFTRDAAERKALFLKQAGIEEEKLSNIDRAIEAYRSVAALEERHPAAVSALFRILESSGRVKDLEELLARQAELASGDSEKHDLLVRLARVRLFDLNEPELGVEALSQLVETDLFDGETVGLLEGVVESHPDRAFRATQLLEHAYTTTKSYEKLADIYRIQIDRFAKQIDKVRRYRDLAAVYEEHIKDPDTAFLYMSSAFKLQPASTDIENKLVGYARSRGSFDELFEIYVDVLSHMEDRAERNALRRRMVALYHDDIRDLDHSETIYRDMLDDEPDSTFALDRLQGLYRDTSNWDKLVDVLRTKVEQARDAERKVSLLYEIATVHREGRSAQASAMDTYEEILGLDARQWDAYRGIESLYREREDVQGVVAVLRRELARSEQVAERVEVRLRLAATLFGEVQENDAAVEELARVFDESPRDAGAMELLQDILDRWETASSQAIGLMVDAHTAGQDWPALVALYQKLAARAAGTAERMQWFERIYEVRTQRQNDEQGAYAVSKIMVTFEPADAGRRGRLLKHGLAVGDLEDVKAFLLRMVEEESVSQAGVTSDYHFLLAAVLEEHLADPATAAAHYEAVAESGRADLIAPARERLRVLYPQLESWPKYVALLETIAGETHAADERKGLLLEAAAVARDTVEDLERALGLLAAAAREYASDLNVLDLYEAVLVRLGRADDLETLYRQRVEIEERGEGRGLVLLRLGNLLVGKDRTSEGVDELLACLGESHAIPAVWTILESLLGSDSVPDEDRIRISLALLAAYPKDVAADRVVAALETHLALETQEPERNRLHVELAKVAEKEGDPDKAFLHYSQSLRLFAGVATVEEPLHAIAEARGLYADLCGLLVELAAAAGGGELTVRYLMEAAAMKRDKLGLPHEAAALWEQVLQTDPVNGDALRELELHWRTVGDPARLADVLEKEVEIESDPVRRLAMSVDVARIATRDLDDVARSRRWWEEVQHEPSARAEAVQNLESLYGRMEDWDQLCDLLLVLREEAQERQERLRIVSRLAALYEQKLDNVPEAFQRYRELLEMDPGFGAGLQGCKRCAVALEDWQTVASVDERLLAGDAGAHAAELREELSHLYFERLGAKKKGLEHLAWLLARPPVSDAMRGLAASHLADAEVGAALCVALEPVLEKAADWSALADLYRTQLKLTADIRERSRVAVKAAEVHAERLSALEEAFLVLSGALEAFPNDEAVLGKLAALAEKHGAWSQYVDVVEKAYGIATASIALSRLAALAAATYATRLNKPGQAIEWYRRVLAEDPSDAEATAAVEELLKRDHKLEELARFYEDSSLNFEGQARIPLLLKLAFVREGELKNPSGAVHAYRDVLAIDPGHPAALARLDAMLDDPILGLAAVEILEPIYRSRGDTQRLARVLVVKAAEVEGSIDRSNLLAEAARLTAGEQGREAEALEIYMQAIRQKVFDAAEVLPAAMALAEKLDRWQDFASALEAVCTEAESPELRLDLLRRLALVYMEKLPNPALAELKLKDILHIEPRNSFALNMLVRVQEAQGDTKQQIATMERLGDAALDPAQAKAMYESAADLAVSLDDPQRATGLLMKARKAAPRDAGVMERLAAIYRAAEQWKELVDVLEGRGALEDLPASVESLQEAAFVASEHLKDTQRGLDICRTALERDGRSMDVMRLMTGLLTTAGKHDELVSVLERLSEVAEGDELNGTLWQLVDIARQSGDTSAAIGYLDRLTEIDPKNAQAVEAKIELLKGGQNLYHLVSTYEEQAAQAEDPQEKVDLLFQAACTLADEIGDRDEAIKRLDAGLALIKGEYRLMNKKAELQVAGGNFAAAVDTYEKIAEGQMDPAVKGGALKAAARLCLRELGDVELAELYAGRLLEALPGDEEAFDLKAAALEKGNRLADLADALAQHAAQVGSGPARAALAKRLAVLYRGPLSDPAQYARWAHEAYREQEDPALVEELLAYHRKAGNFAEVAELLEWKMGYLTRRKLPKEIPALFLDLGRVLVTLGEKEKAVASFKRSVDLDGTDLEALVALAGLLMELGRTEEALPPLQTLLLRINELSGKEQKVSVYLSLARIQLEKKDTKKARTYLTRLLAIDKKHEEATKLLAQLG